MKKINIIMFSVLVCLIMLFACIPKVNAYSEYVSDIDIEQVLYKNNHKLSTNLYIESGYTNYIGNLTFDYGYEEVEGLTYLYIFRYYMEIYGGNTSQFIDNTVSWYIDLNQEVFNQIGVETNDLQAVQSLYELLERSTIKMSVYLNVDGNIITPVVAFVDYDYFTDSEFELAPFNRVQPMYSGTLVSGIEMEFLHTNLLNQTYLYNAYRSDGNTLSKIEDVSITDWLINSVGGLFDTPILGGISIGDILMFVLAIGLLFLFLRFFSGG